MPKAGAALATERLERDALIEHMNGPVPFPECRHVGRRRLFLRLARRGWLHVTEGWGGLPEATTITDEGRLRLGKILGAEADAITNLVQEYGRALGLEHAAAALPAAVRVPKHFQRSLANRAGKTSQTLKATG